MMAWPLTRRLERDDMHQLHRWLLLASVSLATAVVCAPAQASTILDRGLGADSFGLTPEANSPPEFGRCIKVTGGAYTDATCTTTAGASGKAYEWYAAFGSSAPLEKTSFSNVLKAGSVATLETVAATTVTCTGETSTGEITGNKTVGNVIATFTGCAAFGVSCESPGAAGGTIVMSTAEGVLGVEELAAEPVNYKIGEKLFPVGHSGPLASFSCATLPVVVTGAMISSVSSNVMKLTAVNKTKQAKGKQKPESFVGESPEVLMTQIGEGSSAEQSGEMITTSQTNAEKVEINSVV
jgi:hypothetical protein